MTLFYDDFVTGKKFSTRRRTVRQADINSFAKLTGDFNKLHLDARYAKGTVFGGRIAHGALVLSLALGLWYDRDLTRASLVALLGINNVAFRSAVYPGDRIQLVSEVLSKRLSKSRPHAGIVVLKDQVVNDKGKTVLEFERTVLLRTAAGGERSSG
jgi:acyl dehydratase